VFLIYIDHNLTGKKCRSKKEERAETQQTETDRQKRRERDRKIRDKTDRQKEENC